MPEDKNEQPSIFDEPFDEPEEEVSQVSEKEEPAPEPEPEPEVKAEAEEKPEVKEEPEQKTSDKEINFAKLRTKFEDSERNREMLRERLDKIQSKLDEQEQQRLAQINAQTQQQEEQAFEEDPSAYLRRQNEQVQEQLQNIQQQTQQEQQMRQMEQQASSMTQQFVQQQPDYPDAFEYLRSRRFKEYEVQQVPQDKWQEAWDSEAWNFSITQMQQGRNPAKVAYDMAKVYGYSGTEAGQKPVENATNSNVESKIAQIEQGQKAAKSLSEDTAGTDIPSVKPIAEMSNKEFDEYFAKLEAEERKATGSEGFY